MSNPLTSSTIISPETRAMRASRWISRMVLPVGWLALLTGLFWIGDRSLFHKLYYALIATPALIALIMQPMLSARLLRHPILIAYIVFASYMTLTLLWTNSDTSAQSLIKRPVYVLVLLLSAALMASDRSLSITTVAARMITFLSGFFFRAAVRMDFSSASFTFSSSTKYFTCFSSFDRTTVRGIVVEESFRSFR